MSVHRVLSRGLAGKFCARVPADRPGTTTAGHCSPFAECTVASLTASRASLESSRKLRLFTRSRYLSLDLEKKEVKSVHRKPPPPGEKWPEIEMERLEVTPADALLAEDRAFVAACTGGPPPKVSLRDGLRAVQIAAAIKRDLRAPSVDLMPQS